MSLFLTPVTFTVNTVARIFDFRFNRQEGKSVVGEYYEPAAPLAEQQQIIVKQDLASTKIDRSLVSYRCQKLLPDGVTYKPIVVNFTMVCDKQHTAAQRDEAMELLTVSINSDTIRAGISARKC